MIIAFFIHGGALRRQTAEPRYLIVLDQRGRFLTHAVAVEELALEIDDHVSVEEHAHARSIRHGSYTRSLEIFVRAKFFYSVHVARRHHYCHAFLTFGYCKFGSGKSRVFFWHCRKIYIKPRRKLADSYGHAARAEIVTAFYEFCELAVAHEPLQHALYRRVALLHFRAACFYRMKVVSLARAGRAAATVSARFSAQQQHRVARRRFFAHDVFRFDRADYEARFQTLGYVAVVIVFLYFARSKSYLVAVRAVTLRRALAYNALRELAVYGFIERRVYIRRARYAHRLIHVRPARQRIADSAAQARSRTAERFYLRRVVVRFVLIQYVPRLARSVAHDNVVLYSARIDLGRNVLRAHVTLLFEHFRADGRNVHERRIFISSALVRGVEHIRIIGIRLRDMRIVRFDLGLERGQERGVPAMVRPIRVYHLKLGIRRLATRAAEVRLNKDEIVHAHRETLLFIERVKRDVRFLRKAFDEPRRFGFSHFLLERTRLFERAQSALDGVYQIPLYRVERLVRALHGVHRRATHSGTRALSEELNALRRRIGALIELPRQILYAEHLVVARQRGQRFAVYRIGRGRGKHHGCRFFKVGVRQALHVVTYKRSRFYLYAEVFVYFALESDIARCPFGIYSLYHKLLAMLLY